MQKLLFMSITAKCNLSCDYCPVKTWRNNPAYPDSLTLEICKSIIERLRPTHAEVTGGEPTLVPWLDGLLDYLEEKKIVYLVKSNGYRRCRNQVTAWHGSKSEMPENHGKILIIRDTEGWESKAEQCRHLGIPFRAIGFNGDFVQGETWDFGDCSQLFLCPDGKIKQCHEMETGKPEWKPANCRRCKAVEDFFAFLGDW